MSNSKQIFQTQSKIRWRAYQWTGRIIVFGIALIIPVIVFTFAKGIQPNLPALQNETDSIRHLSHPAIPPGLNEKELKKYKGFNDFSRQNRKMNS
jgi:peptidoglycan-N-acetylglucosamine deacetylase